MQGPLGLARVPERLQNLLKGVAIRRGDRSRRPGSSQPVIVERLLAPEGIGTLAGLSCPTLDLRGIATRGRHHDR